VVTVSNPSEAVKIEKSYADHQTKWAGELKDAQDKAEALEAGVEKAEARADRFRSGRGAAGDWPGDHLGDPSDAQPCLLYLGIVFSAAGVVSAFSAYFLH